MSPDRAIEKMMFLVIIKMWKGNNNYKTIVETSLKRKNSHLDQDSNPGSEPARRPGDQCSNPGPGENLFS